jgi:two-component system sensor histidine kinase KdpD
MPLTEEETRLLATFATQAALAVDRARLADESAQAAILRESDRAKSTLLSNVSHDLRTPLTTIRGAAESLLASDVLLDEQTRQELLTSIRDDAERLTALVGNLLGLSRLEAGSLQPEQHLYNLSEIVGSVLVRLRQQLARHQVSLVMAPEVPPVLVDYMLFEQVLVNLLDNAVKYSPEDTTITIRLRREGGQVILSVADQGPGIPRTARNRVFERFYRLPEIAGKRGAGTGLGLAICQAVVAAHGGRIWIENGPEPGTTISIALPIRLEPPSLNLAAAGDAQ